MQQEWKSEDRQIGKDPERNTLVLCILTEQSSYVIFNKYEIQPLPRNTEDPTGFLVTGGYKTGGLL